MRYVAIGILFTSLFVSVQSQAWTVVEGFESGTAGSQASHGYRDTKNTKNFVHSGKQAAEAFIAAGDKGKYWGGGLTFPASLKEGDEIWYRLYAYFPSGFNFNGAPVVKFMRIHVAGPGGSNNGWTSLFFDGGVNGGELKVDHEVNHSAFFKSSPNNGNVASISTGKWSAYELYIKFSATPGKGIIRVWKDGALKLEDKKAPTFKSSGDSAGRALIGTYWNGGSPKSQKMYIDDVVWTSQTPSNRDAKGNPFIGLGKSSPSPTAPEPEKASPPKPPVIK